MAQPPDKPQNRTTDLPNPELNPLLNPILGRNLGRWAHVYFTSPPEKREEAVVELLRELEGNSAPANSDPGTPLPEALKAQTVPEFAPCPECSQPNGKWQRYCGMCGTALSPEERARLKTSAPPVKVQGNGHHEVEKMRESAQPQEPETERYPTLSLFASSEPADSWPSETYGSSDTRWLRDQGLGADEGSSRLGVYALAACSLLVLAGVIFYAQFRSKHSVLQDLRPTNTSQEVSSPQQAPQQAPAPQASAPQTSAASPSTPQGSARQTSQSNQGVTPANPPVTEHATAPPPAAQAATPSPAQRNAQAAVSSRSASGSRVNAAAEREAVPTAGDLPAGSATKPVGGTIELATAQQYLSGKGRSRDSAAAATWLWAAVRKENPTAVLLLSQLYLAGDGVNKNCEQARVLLTSAARKNVPGAAEQLSSLKRSGCK